ncbi:MAG: aryl-sulfate sulfotransferase [Paramuribaculum sp.]|nr:aryl-sulfate sulfotransferase [Paramuribaculum sp.]
MTLNISKVLSLGSKMSMTALALSASLWLTSCNDDDTTVNVTVQNVLINSDATNALRYPVSVATSGDCDVTIKYWPVKEPENVRTTRTIHTSAPTANSINSAQLTINFVTPSTPYCFQVETNGVTHEQVYTFTTSELPAGVPTYTINVDNGGAPEKGYILQWQASNPGFVTFCDMQGRVVWYEKFDQAIRMAHYDTEHDCLCVLTGFRDGVNSKNFQRLCDKIITVDLYGNREIQWVASDDNVPYPHHDIKFTPEGNLIMVCNTIKNFDLSSYVTNNNGLALGEDEEVWGDGFTIISRGGEVIRKWNNFEEMDPFNSDDIILEGGAVKDFLHANSVNWDSNGDYYMTFNRRSELWKIDGATGKVLYRVGPKGNVKLDESGFASGLHAVEPLAPNKLLCLDNGEERGYSRALIYEVDPAAMSAKVTMSVDFPAEFSSLDRSNVQLICNGTMLMFGSTLGRCALFADLEGNVLKVIKRNGISYRTYYYEDIK